VPSTVTPAGPGVPGRRGPVRRRDPPAGLPQQQPREVTMPSTIVPYAACCSRAPSYWRSRRPPRPTFTPERLAQSRSAQSWRELLIEHYDVGASNYPRSTAWEVVSQYHRAGRVSLKCRLVYSDAARRGIFSSSELMLPAVDLGGRVWLGGKPCKGSLTCNGLPGAVLLLWTPYTYNPNCGWRRVSWERRCETCRQRRPTCSIIRRRIRKNPRRVGDS
jgi:hypothetical protein